MYTVNTNLCLYTTVGMKKFGMGKLTICSLIYNVIKSYKMQNKNIQRMFVRIKNIIKQKKVK